jgi:hypothetical protein
VLNEMMRLDEAMSTYKPSSEVSKVNADAAKHPVKISKELFDLLSKAVEFSRMTHGAFDITYASVGFMYDFRAHEKPTEQQIKSALPSVNYKHLLTLARRPSSSPNPVCASIWGHRQGVCSGSRHRTAAGAWNCACAGERGGEVASSVIVLASRGSSAFVIPMMAAS